MPNIVITLSGWELPEQHELVQISGLKSSDVKVLSGAIYTDYISRYGAWSIKWEELRKADYDALYAIWTDQFDSEQYPTLSIPYYGVLGPAKLDINDKNIKFDGNRVIDVQITLREQYAIS